MQWFLLNEKNLFFPFRLAYIKTSYLLSALKEPLQIDYNKACCVMEQAWISTFADIFVKNIFTLKYRKPKDSLYFQGA